MVITEVLIIWYIYRVNNINVNLQNSSGKAVDASGLKLYVSNKESVKTNTDVKDENLELTSEWPETTGKTDYDESLTVYALLVRLVREID